jgi:hypothetical protein
MNYMDAEELAMAVLGLSDEAADDADFDELIFEKFEVTMEQFHKIAEALVPFTIPATVLCSGDAFRGFVKDGYFITKQKVTP